MKGKQKFRVSKLTVCQGGIVWGRKFVLAEGICDIG